MNGINQKESCKGVDQSSRSSNIAVAGKCTMVPLYGVYEKNALDERDG